MTPYQMYLRQARTRHLRPLSYGTDWEVEHPEISEVYYIVQLAIRLGWLKRQPCVVCGAKSEAHHRDYSKPLAVTWLCRLHHRRVHASEAKAS